jgi:alkylhydroperoxidase/carboxymuconolactone decarboxylase family protein YurZ
MVACESPGEGGASAGRALAGDRLRILGNDGADLPPGEPGEIVIQGPTVSPGYFDPVSGQVSGGCRRWLRTGDLGVLDSCGRLQVIGRRDDLIIAGGVNVDPAEVEAVLLEHPRVAEACVVGLPHREWGETVAAAVVSRGASAPDPDELEALCRGRLSSAKIPRLIRTVDALPRTEAGKLRRRVVRDGWGVQAGAARGAGNRSSKALYCSTAHSVEHNRRDRPGAGVETGSGPGPRPGGETMSHEMPKHYLSVKERYPEVASTLDDLREHIRASGPLDDKTAQLIQLAGAAGIQSEGSLLSHARQALEAGATRDELYHSVLLLTTTIGFPRVAAAIKWLDEIS